LSFFFGAAAKFTNKYARHCQAFGFKRSGCLPRS